MAQVIISLSKLLKLKSRIAARIARLSADVKEHNSVVVGQVPRDIIMMLAKHDELVNAMIIVKGLRHEANQGIANTLHALEELKSKHSWLKDVDTVEGPTVKGYRDSPLTYQVTINAIKLDEMVTTLTSEIDDLQDKVDAYNLTTQVKIDDSIIALVRK